MADLRRAYRFFSPKGNVFAFVLVEIPSGLMLWLWALAVSSLTGQSMQTQHQRLCLNQNKSVFMVFVFVVGLCLLLTRKIQMIQIIQIKT
jgi:hypothetical protein